MASVDVSAPRRALAIGAHPDDIEFGCGATLAKWAASGCEVTLMVCTDGSKGTWNAQADISELVAQRKREQSAAAAHLGAAGRVIHLDEEDGVLGHGRHLRAKVIAAIREVRPGVVLGHDPWKRWRLHPDHRAAGFLCTDAVAGARDPLAFTSAGVRPHRPGELLLFECEQPDHFESVSEAAVEAKVDALLAHESQHESTHGISPGDSGAQRQAFIDGVVAECRAAGYRAGVAYAEAFKRVTGL